MQPQGRKCRRKPRSCRDCPGFLCWTPVSSHLARNNDPRGEPMQAKDVVRSALNSTQNMLEMYLSDLSDADLLVRPVPNANHIAWQLGHLIISEPELVHMELPDAAYPKLPAGFAEQHSRETAGVDPPKGFRTKAEYLALAKQVRGATLALLDK